jgi:hypothetical protein
MDRSFLRLLDYWTEASRRFEEAQIRRENLRSGLREVRVDLHCDAILARRLGGSGRDAEVDVKDVTAIEKF